MPAAAMHDGTDHDLFAKYAKVAQRIGVYTVKDYSEIITDLVRHWKIETLQGLSHAAEQAQDYLANLSLRYEKLAERAVTDGQVSFSWIYGKTVG